MEAGGRSVTYSELDLAASRAARQLAHLGVGEGDRVATTLPPGIEFAVLLHAVPRLGAALAPLDPRAPARVEARLTVSGPLEGEEADVAPREGLHPTAAHTVIHTSGTTGAPRAVELTAATHEASARASAALLGVDPADRWLGVLPVFHVGGLAILIRSAIQATTAVLHDGFDAPRVRAELESGRITLASLVPTMLHRLREAGLERAPGLRAVLLGGGPIPPELLAWARDAKLPLAPTYGMTEAASQIATVPPQEALGGETGARPLPGVEVAIGPAGEILVAGPVVAPGARAPDGWLHTGDRGRLDAEGRLHVEGRLKELIVTGGENVAPAEVEGVLASHPLVADAAVVGTPDPEWGEAIAALVVASGALSEEDLLLWCRERLPGHKVPKRVAFVDRLPRGATGKLRRSELAPLAERRPG